MSAIHLNECSARRSAGYCTPRPRGREDDGAFNLRRQPKGVRTEGGRELHAATRSAVILMLTKYFDFTTGRVTESSLWRSTDYGTTYEKLNERVGLKTVLSYLYVSPNNKRKIMLLTDPEGRSYQRHGLGFDILSLLFHPEQEDWILAYSHDQKVLYVSVEFGRRWQLVHDNVVANRFYWSRLGLDKEQGMIHLEIGVSDKREYAPSAVFLECSTIMLLTDPEVESSLLISDEGANYQKYRLSFYILSLLFHPEQEDWILAYSHDQKVLYVSVEFGRRWQLVHDNVVANRFYWSRLGLDKEQGMIHLEIGVSDKREYAPGSQYITCKLQNCSEGSKGRPFPGFIRPDSLVVQDLYVFIQTSRCNKASQTHVDVDETKSFGRCAVRSVGASAAVRPSPVLIGGQAVHYVSYKRKPFSPMKLPKYTLPKLASPQFAPVCQLSSHS
ncbi:hypothetical protein CRUP_034564 [Coryphaenoides rupestris]|nr:hypothetical protein CRUP_034564 [Coryphaenoides rupestris]